ncbi:MAG: EAL domain-containing protein, partial [Candidatus Baltobacteraceae bacterium]
PSALELRETPRAAIAKNSAGEEIEITARAIDSSASQMTILELWASDSTISEPARSHNYSRLEALWQMVVEPGHSASQLAEAILKEGTASLGMEYGAIGFVDGDDIVIEHILGDGTMRSGMRVPFDSTLASGPLLTGRVLEVADVDNCPPLRRHPMVERFFLRSLIAVQFAARSRKWALTLTSRRPRSRALMPAERAYLQLLTEVFARLIEQAEQQERLSQLAFHDTLTALPNRGTMIARVGEQIALARRTKARVGLLFIDIDRFKQINDTNGHAAGDAVLREFATRVRETLREYEVIGRVGGDEFAVLIPGFAHEQDLGEVAERILACVAKPFEFPDGSTAVSISIGIATFPNDASSREELIAHADAAMYHAKSQPGPHYYWYNADLARRIDTKSDLESHLRKGEPEREFLLCYQPIIETAGGELCAAEALLRWQHPSQGMLLPASFLDVARRDRLSELIDQWVINAAFEQASKWSTPERTLPVYINISQPSRSVSSAVVAAIQERQFDPALLAIELSERAISDDFEVAAAVFSELRERGVRTGIDAFGSAGLPIARLANLPVDFVKLDRDLTANLFKTATSAAALEAAILLARKFGWFTIAEGVESEKQRRWLEDKNVDAIQGYSIAHPLTSADFTAWCLRRQVYNR